MFGYAWVAAMRRRQPDQSGFEPVCTVVGKYYDTVANAVETILRFDRLDRPSVRGNMELHWIDYVAFDRIKCGNGCNLELSSDDFEETAGYMLFYEDGEGGHFVV